MRVPGTWYWVLGTGECVRDSAEDIDDSTPSTQYPIPSTVLTTALLLTLALTFESCLPSAPRFRSGGGSTASTTTGAHAGVDAPSIDSRSLSVAEGVASYYADEFNGRRTSSGETFDMNKLTCTHPTYDFGTKLRVVNLDNGRECQVVVNDRGPFAKDRIIDLSYAAARDIGMIGPGTARVRLEVLEWGAKKQ